MSEEYTKDSDYEITVVSKSSKELVPSGWMNATHPMHQTTELAKTFNFQSNKLTTVLTKMIYQAAKDKENGSSAAIAMNTTTEYFHDIPNKMEIEQMHAKLIELNGKPPSLDIVLGMGSFEKPFQ